MRGYGGTDAPHDPAEYDHFTHILGDLLAIVAHTGHETAVLVGHDWGAQVRAPKHLLLTSAIHFSSLHACLRLNTFELARVVWSALR